MQSEEEYNKNRMLLYGEDNNTFKLTRQQKRKAFKQDKFSNKIKQLLK